MVARVETFLWFVAQVEVFESEWSSVVVAAPVRARKVVAVCVFHHSGTQHVEWHVEVAALANGRGGKEADEGVGGRREFGPLVFELLGEYRPDAFVPKPPHHVAVLAVDLGDERCDFRVEAVGEGSVGFLDCVVECDDGHAATVGARVVVEIGHLVSREENGGGPGVDDVGILVLHGDRHCIARSHVLEIRLVHLEGGTHVVADANELACGLGGECKEILQRMDIPAIWPRPNCFSTMLLMVATSWPS